MQHVLYPGHAGQPCAGEYAIALDHSDTFARADIVLVSRLAHGGASFYNADFGRDAVVNRILANELKGIRHEWIRLFVLVEKTAPGPGRRPDFFGMEITKIELDTDDFVAKGNRCTVKRRNILSRLFTGISKEICYWSGDVVGGCANVTTSCEESRHLGRDEIHDLCARIGIATREQPIGRDNPPAGPTATTNTLSSSAYH
jgi:hypothetical protein